MIRSQEARGCYSYSNTIYLNSNANRFVCLTTQKNVVFIKFIIFIFIVRNSHQIYTHTHKHNAFHSDSDDYDAINIEIQKFRWGKKWISTKRRYCIVRYCFDIKIDWSLISRTHHTHCAVHGNLDIGYKTKKMFWSYLIDCCHLIFNVTQWWRIHCSFLQSIISFDIAWHVVSVGCAYPTPRNLQCSHRIDFQSWSTDWSLIQCCFFLFQLWIAIVSKV